ncbi:unnamed protein product [Peronospora destructor]|uniref:Uncharacterized protein n=1 Tax=Peronospora destructor TaxID=86335 RepID=A0AAV0UFC3_9STRA|nr:unnamed protein product [Peronospora destructor]
MAARQNVMDLLQAAFDVVVEVVKFVMDGEQKAPAERYLMDHLPLNDEIRLATGYNKLEYEQHQCSRIWVSVQVCVRPAKINTLTAGTMMFWSKDAEK